MRHAVFLLFVAFASAAWAGGPRIVADIPPIHALAAEVAGPDAEVALMVAPGASPHGYALRPSEAGNLQAADLVVWVGPELTPWLTRSVTNLAPEAEQLRLMSVQGMELLPYREDHDGSPEHDHHAEGGGPHDPHIWLDPENAKRAVAAIAAALSRQAPDAAEGYQARAAAAIARIDAVSQEIEAVVAPVKGAPFLVLHDAYQYFEARFGLRSRAALTDADALRPGPARLAALRERMRDDSVRCVFSEPQTASRLVDVVIEGQPAKHRVLDPLGARLAPGPGLYTEMLQTIGLTLADCLAGR